MRKLPLPEDACAEDIQPGELLTVSCVCGRHTHPATAHWPMRARRIPLTILGERMKLKCVKCDAPAVRVAIEHPRAAGTEVLYEWRAVDPTGS